MIVLDGNALSSGHTRSKTACCRCAFMCVPSSVMCVGAKEAKHSRSLRLVAAFDSESRWLSCSIECWLSCAQLLECVNGFFSVLQGSACLHRAHDRAESLEAIDCFHDDERQSHGNHGCTSSSMNLVIDRWLQDGSTCLHKACHNGANHEMIEFLLDKDPNSQLLFAIDHVSACALCFL